MSRATASSNPAEPVAPAESVAPAVVVPGENLLPGDGEAFFTPEGLAPAAADRAFADLRAEIDWRQETAMLFGRRIPLPRLTAWYGDTGYAYSGIRHPPAPWPPRLEAIKAMVEEIAHARFNSVLLNLYRDGRDSMGWHSDDETVLGPEPLIASLSLGAARRFQFRHRRTGETVSFDLPHGACLVMKGRCQANWRHQIPKTRRPVTARINLTFRRLDAD